jgi:SAM-dependent methyltransferase
MNINKIAQLDDMSELTDELNYLRQIGYSGEHDNIYYDYIYKWARILKIVKLLNKSSQINILEIGGGLSPLQFIFSNNNCHVFNLDENFNETWFPTHGKYYVKASQDFINESNKNLKNITYLKGNIMQTIKYISNNSIDIAIDTCAMHIFINNELINEITRVLKPNGYLLSVGDIANPYLGKCDNEFYYPKDFLVKLTCNKNLKIVEPFDYDNWDNELKDYDNIIPRKNVDYNNLSLINMKSDPTKIPYKNIPTYPIHIWTATYLLQKKVNIN